MDLLVKRIHYARLNVRNNPEIILRNHLICMVYNRFQNVYKIIATDFHAFYALFGFYFEQQVSRSVGKRKRSDRKKIDRGPDQSGPGQHQAGPAHSSPGACGIQR
jgi:hypothetical protein